MLALFTCEVAVMPPPSETEREYPALTAFRRSLQPKFTPSAVLQSALFDSKVKNAGGGKGLGMETVFFVDVYCGPTHPAIVMFGPNRYSTVAVIVWIPDRCWPLPKSSAVVIVSAP